MRPDLIGELKEIVGAENVLTDPEDLYCYTYDASFVQADPKKELPGAAVFPGSAGEISRILKLANREKIPVIPRGSGSNLTGGTIPSGDCIVMNLRMLDKILEIDRQNLIAVVEAGVITAQFQQDVEKHNLYYPPDPQSQSFSTMGGNVAECAGGPHGVKYGVTKNYILGLEVVLPTGEIINTGGRVMKNVTGYDLTALFVGCEGTLGVITKIIVKLVPLPEAKKTMLAAFDRIDQASETVSEIIAGGIIPTTLELLDNTYIRNIEEYAHVGLPVEADAVLLIEVDGDREILDKHIGKIAEVCRKNGTVQIRIARDDAEAAELWRARKAAFASLARVRPTIVTEDCTVPRSEIPKMIRKIREIAAKYNLTIGVLGHAGDGNLHADLLADERDQEEMGRVDQAVEEMLKYTLELKGSLSGEHGIGRAKKKYIGLQIGVVSLAVQHRIKQALDPNNILNPGVMFGE